MPNLMPFDEINQLREDLSFSTYEDPETKKRKFIRECDDIIGDIYAMLVLSYQNGLEDVAEMLGVQIPPQNDKARLDTIYAPVKGKTFEDRIREYVDGTTPKDSKTTEQSPKAPSTDTSSVEDIMRVAETESHRVYNTAASQMAQEYGAKFKTYCTMLDDRVRDTHDYLEGKSIPINEEFWTYDGDHAMAPGLFQNPENNVNCRCWLNYSK